jgi:RraA family protein
VTPPAPAAFAGIPTAVLSDCLDRLAGCAGLRAFHRQGAMAGRALTVRTRPGDNLAVHRALEILAPGEVLVIDGGGDTTRALVGEIVRDIARARGAAGLVVDGAIRDAAAFAAGDFPCFARAVCLRGPYKDGPGQIGVPVVIGGAAIAPGDHVVGDADGVIAFSPADAARLLDAARDRMTREAETLTAIAEGRYRSPHALSEAAR